ncbi:hypothetical protein HDU98_011884, partial [Podochytrium sp. JEL0797]
MIKKRRQTVAHSILASPLGSTPPGNPMSVENLVNPEDNDESQDARKAALLEGLSPDERRKVQNREAQRKSRANREKQIELLEVQ